MYTYLIHTGLKYILIESITWHNVTQNQISFTPLCASFMNHRNMLEQNIFGREGKLVKKEKEMKEIMK